MIRESISVRAAKARATLPKRLSQTGASKVLWCLLALLGLISSGINAGASTYYVANAGNDSNNGTSATTPWKTVAKVISELPSLSGGDQVLFNGGDVWNEQFDINNVQGTGTVTSYCSAPPCVITFSSYGTGQPVLDEQGKNSYCIDAIGTVAKYLTFDNFECRHATKQGVTFQTSGGAMPGITVKRFYIHNSGPGADRSNGATVGRDSGGYLNQLDFEDSAQGADGVQFLDNTVKWAGGHNCLQVHHDTGAVVVQGNTVGPGCVHGVIDVKGVGSPTTPAIVTQNTATCGFNEKLCGCERNGCNPTPAFYTENVYSPNETLTYSLNVAYDSGVGFQDCPGGCADTSGCGMNVKYYNNTVYIGSSVPNSYAIYATGTCDGAAASGPVSIDLRSNIFDGSKVYVNGINSPIENYNDIGGSQGNAGFSIDGSNSKGANDIGTPNVEDPNANPNYTSSSTQITSDEAQGVVPNFELMSPSPCSGTGDSTLGILSDNDMGAY